MDFLQSNAKSENGFLLIEIRPDGGFLLRIPNPDFLDFLFTVRLRNPKTTVLIWNCFSNPFSDFQKKNGKKGNSRTHISALKSVFQILRSILNPDFNSQSNAPFLLVNFSVVPKKSTPGNSPFFDISSELE